MIFNLSRHKFLNFPRQRRRNCGRSESEGTDASSSEFDGKTGEKRKAGRQGQEKRSRRARPRRKRVTRPRNSKITTSRSYWDSISNKIVKLFFLSPRDPGREAEGSVSEDESGSETTEMQNRFVVFVSLRVVWNPLQVINISLKIVISNSFNFLLPSSEIYKVSITIA